MYTNRNFIIFNIEELNKINFQEVEETSVSTVRLSVDGTKTFVKWDTETIPESVNSLETKEGPYTYDQMLNILTGSFWDEGMTI